MVSGANSSLHAKQEATFLAVTTCSTGVLGGHGLKITSFEKNNNLQAVWGLGSRTQTVTIEKQFTGTLGLEFIMSNPWFLFPILGIKADGGSGPASYTHTFTEADTLPSFKFNNSLNIDTASTADLNISIMGVVNTGASISTAVGDAVSVSMDFVYATESIAESAFVAQTAETYQPYTFAHGVLEFPNGTTVANCQAVDISISQNADMVWGLGSRLGTAHVDKNRAYSIRTSAYFTSTAAFLKLFYNGTTGTSPGNITEIATLQLTFTNGTQIVEFTFSGLKIDTDALPQSVDAATMEDISILARTLTVVCTDSTATFPAVLAA
jgi:hypothetical protein